MKIKVAIAQIAPEVLNLNGSIEKACDIIRQAGRDGVHLLAFPETWLPVYPLWVDMGSFSKWDDERSKKLYTRLHKNSLVVDSDQTKELCTAARESGVFVVMGANEREESSRTIYNSLVFIDGDGAIRSVHRKLVPTFGERLVW